MKGVQPREERFRSVREDARCAAILARLAPSWPLDLTPPVVAHCYAVIMTAAEGRSKSRQKESNLLKSNVLEYV